MYNMYIDMGFSLFLIFFHFFSLELCLSKGFQHGTKVGRVRQRL